MKPYEMKTSALIRRIAVGAASADEAAALEDELDARVPVPEQVPEDRGVFVYYPRCYRYIPEKK